MIRRQTGKYAFHTKKKKEGSLSLSLLQEEDPSSEWFYGTTGRLRESVNLRQKGRSGKPPGRSRLGSRGKGAIRVFVTPDRLHQRYKYKKEVQS